MKNSDEKGIVRQLSDGRWKAKKAIDKVAYQKVYPATLSKVQAEIQAKKWLEEVVSANEYRRRGVAAYEAQLLLGEEMGVSSEVAELPPPFVGRDGTDDIAWWKGELAKGDGRSRLDLLGEVRWEDVWKEYLARRVEKAKNPRYITHAQKWTFDQVGKRLTGKFPSTDAAIGLFLEGIGNQIRKSDYAPSTKNGILRILSGFVHRLHKDSRLQNLPRNFDDITAREKGTTRTAKAIPIGDLAKIWDSAYPDMRCYIALALNCGFYQRDIQLLTLDMLDLKSKRIAGERYKTKVPYDFPLWSETVRWIRERIDKEDRMKHGGQSGYLFSTKRGGMLKSPRNMFGDVQVRLWGEQRYSFSMLRDTGATIVHNEIDPGMTSMYLRHSVKGMKGYYIDKKWRSPLLDAAIVKLRGKFPFLKNDEAPKYSGANARKLNKKRWGEGRHPFK